MRKKEPRLLIVGAGAAGLPAAIAAAQFLRDGNSPGTVTVLEADIQAGRKIRVTGNGRCNLTNRHQTAACYHTGDGREPFPLDPTGWDEIVLSFMNSIGVLTHERMGGYVYPRTDQAQTVSDALVKRCGDLGVELHTGMRVESCQLPESLVFGNTATGRRISRDTSEKEKGFLLRCTDGEGTEHFCGADRLIVASGGLGHFRKDRDGCWGEDLAAAAGHTVIRPVPALCALHSDAPFLKRASGVRTAASLRLLCDGRMIAESSGELQMTDSGISGIPVFQLSRWASRALEDRKGTGPDLCAVIDFLPEISEDTWRRECERRIGRIRERDTLADFFRGLVPEKIADWILADQNLVKEKRILHLRHDSGERNRLLQSLLEELRAKTIRITGVDRADHAQVTAGGVPLSEITETMESKLVGGLYFAGEILDVDGICGGYNLTWAILSGLRAGRAAAESLLLREALRT